MPGTAPTGWQNPKTSYTAEDVLTPEQFERIEGNAYATELGARTIDPSQSPTGVIGTLRQLLDWFANRIRAILGTTNWYDAPPTTLTAAKSHIDAAAPHSGHATTTALTEHTSAAAPHSGHETPTGAQAKVDTHAAGTSVHGATSAATANRIMIRDAAGRAKVAAPSASDDIARKDTVDNAVAPLASKDTLEALLYDQYNLHMELYYTGHHGGPSIAGLKGMTFDGFVDTGRVNTGSTTAVVDTANKIVRCPLGTSWSGRPSFQTEAAIAAIGFKKTSAFTNVANISDGSASTYAEMSAGAGTDQYTTTKHDLGQNRLIKTITIRAKGVASETGGRAKLAYSLDGTNWTVSETVSFDDTTVKDWTITLGAPIVARYLAFEWQAHGWDGYAEPKASTIYVYDITVAGTPLASGILQSTTKVLEDNITAATLYLSYKLAGGSLTVQASNDGGSTWRTLNQASSRTDPQFSDFTEGRYEASFSIANKNVILKVTLTPPANSETGPEIKRYGLYWT